MVNGLQMTDILLQILDPLNAMGWLPSWGSSGEASEAAPKAKDGSYEAPDRTKRVQCWDSRDIFFQCLNRNNILDAIKDHDAAEQACGNESKYFETNCAKSWVRLFIRIRCVCFIKFISRDGHKELHCTSLNRVT